MASASYDARRGELTTYFDRTAVDAWSRLTSDAPVSRIRATVRAGRDAMRATLLAWLPADMTGLRLLDAGCGTGALSVEAARRGAEVVAIATRPKSAGTKSRAKTSVLTSPSARVTMRQAISHAAPTAVRAPTSASLAAPIYDGATGAAEEGGVTSFHKT